MKLIDLTHSTTRKAVPDNAIPVVVRSIDSTHLIPLDRLVTLATVVDLTEHLRKSSIIDRLAISKTGVADIGGCILYTGWCDRYMSGDVFEMPVLTVDAAAYLLEGGVRTIASDFPISNDTADMLLHNNCVLVHCLSNVLSLSKDIVRLVALPIKYEDTYSAEARVIAIEE